MSMHSNNDFKNKMLKKSLGLSKHKEIHVIDRRTAKSLFFHELMRKIKDVNMSE